MFLLSKVFLFVVNPGVWFPALLVAGTALLWTRRQRLGKAILTATVGFATVLSTLPVGSLLSGPLEDRFPTVRTLPARIDGIVVLGGTVNQAITRARGQPALTDGAERVTEFVAMARAHPEARLIFTGGSASILHQDIKETEVARLFFAQMGLDTGRIVFEGESRNTWENAVETHRLMQPKPGETWVLITSAQHMPRAMGAFRKVGWQPLAYPVDYVTDGTYEFRFRFDMIGAIDGLWWSMREWMGLAVYYALGRSDTLFPGPVAGEGGKG